MRLPSSFSRWLADDIGDLLKSRPHATVAASRVRGENYNRAVDALLGKALDREPQTEGESDAEKVLEEGRSAQLILSNPIDLTYAQSELIAMGLGASALSND